MKHGNSKQSNSDEVTFNFGYFYRTIEEQVDAFAVQAGGPGTVADVAERLADLLWTKAKNVRAISGTAELLQQMREDGAAAGKGARNHASGQRRSKVHVRPRIGRTLSDQGRKNISRAQEKRWRARRSLSATEKAEQRREYQRRWYAKRKAEYKAAVKLAEAEQKKVA